MDPASILLVEDEPAIQLAIRGVLRREGHELRVASSGADALNLLADAPFDLVLTDLALPDGVSGLDIVRFVRANRPGVPVVLITAYGSGEVADETMDGSSGPSRTTFTISATVVSLERTGSASSEMGHILVAALPSLLFDYDTCRSA